MRSEYIRSESGTCRLLTRLIVFLIAAALLLPLAACAKTGNGEQTQDSSTTADTAAETTAAVTLEPDDIPDTLKFGGEQVNILCWDSKTDFVIDPDDATDAVLSEINKRNQIAKSRLDVNLEWTQVPGSWNDRNSYVEKTYNDVQSGGYYDIFSGYSLTGALMAVKGVSRDLLTLDTINFSKPWWPETLLETNTINGKVYFVSGDISADLLYTMYCFFVNKELFADTHPGRTVDELYKYVDIGSWTLDAFFSECQDLWSDVNANGEHDIGDRYGFVAEDPCIDAFYIASDLKFLDKNDEGKIIVSDQVRSEKTLTLLERLNGFFRTDMDGLLVSTAQNAGSGRGTFNNGLSVFALEIISYAKTLQVAADFSYGIIPLPKFNADQSQYYTCNGFAYSNYSVSAGSGVSESAAAAVIECLASEGYRNVTPLVFETTMKYRYADAPDDARMFDIVHDSIVFECGRSFALLFDSKPFGLFRLALRDQTVNSWNRQVTVNWSKLNSYADEVNNALG